MTVRMAVCGYNTCDAVKPSSPELPMFQPRPDEETDLFYDGCKGWD